MAFVTTILPEHVYAGGNTARIRWTFPDGSRPDWSAVAALDEAALGQRIQLYGDNGRTGLTASASQTANAGGELSDAFEVYNSAITYTVPGLDALVMGGPNDPLNDGSQDQQDPDEPYDWRPGTNARYGESGSLTDWVTDFVSAYDLDNTLRVTLTLDDGVGVVSASPTFTDVSGNNAQWVVGEAIDVIQVPVAAATPIATYSAISLPSGISFNTSSRQITGTPTTIEGSGTVRIRATNSVGTADWTLSYQTFRVLDGYEQAIPISAALITTDTDRQKQWRLDDSDAVELDAFFSPVGETRYLRRLIVRNDVAGIECQLRLFFADSASVTPGSSGDALRTEWEEYDLAVVCEQGTDRVIVSGPEHVDNFVSDATEPYSWAPAPFEQQVAEQFFFSDLDTLSDWTFTLRVPVVPLSVSHSFSGALSGELSATATLGDTSALSTTHSFSGALSGDLSATATLGDASALSTTHSFSGL